MNKMLISATQADEVRVALVKGQTLCDLDTEHPDFEQKKANIYKARVSRIEPSLEAAFIDYGAERHGFLPFKEIARSFFKPELANEPFSNLSIKDALHEGQEILIQIDKEERGSKGAALTTFISLAGSYLVLMPNNPRVGGISRRIEGKERDTLRDLLSGLNLPEGMGLIIRTAGVGKSLSELKWDLESLMNRWNAIKAAVSENRPAPFLIYQEGDAVMRAIRDYLRQDIVEILVDNQELFERTKKYIEQVKPDFIDKIKLYENKIPLFSFYQIEKQIETAYQRIVRLPSGGSISIDHTEALVSIDVNSAKATGGSDIEETAFNTNLEAAEEIARQLRLRDIGGLIVIDFIDMSQVKHQREVSRKLREALEYDRARVQVGHITRFGLLEMSRQRLRSYLGEATQVSCPRCEGQGTIRSVESLASSLIRIIEEEAVKEKVAEIQLQVPIELDTFMLNEQRNSIIEISHKQKTTITILPNKHFETPKYKIKRLNKNEAAKNKKASYKVVDTPEPETIKKQETAETHTEKPVVNMLTEEGKKYSAKPGFFHKLVTSVGNIFKSNETPQAPKKTGAAVKTPDDKNRPSAKPRTRQPQRGQKKFRRGNYKDRKQENRQRNYNATQKSTKSSYSSKKISPPPSEQYPELTAEKIKDNPGYPDSSNVNTQTVSAPTDSSNTLKSKDTHLFEPDSQNRTITSSYPSTIKSDSNSNFGSIDVESTETRSSG